MVFPFFWRKRRLWKGDLSRISQLLVAALLKLLTIQTSSNFFSFFLGFFSPFSFFASLSYLFTHSSWEGMSAS